MSNGRCDLLLERAVLADGMPPVYVGPFDRICHGLGALFAPRNYRLERNYHSISHSAECAPI